MCTYIHTHAYIYGVSIYTIYIYTYTSVYICTHTYTYIYSLIQVFFLHLIFFYLCFFHWTTEQRENRWYEEVGSLGNKEHWCWGWGMWRWSGPTSPFGHLSRILLFQQSQGTFYGSVLPQWKCLRMKTPSPVTERVTSPRAGSRAWKRSVCWFGVRG